MHSLSKPTVHPRLPFLRIILALSLFGCAVVAILLFIPFKKKHSLVYHLKSRTTQPQTTPNSANSDLFYQAIGQTVADGKPETDQTLPDRFTLEIATTNDQVTAEKHIDALLERGIQAYYTPLQQGAHVIYRVRLGVYNDEKAANLAAKRLKVAQHTDSKVVKLR